MKTRNSFSNGTSTAATAKNKGARQSERKLHMRSPAIYPSRAEPSKHNTQQHAKLNLKRAARECVPRIAKILGQLLTAPAPASQRMYPQLLQPILSKKAPYGGW